MKLNNQDIKINTLTISQLLAEQNINPKGIAIAVNNKVVPRIEWEEHIVTDDDSVVVITAAYGG